MTLAKCTRFRSPPLRSPTRFSCIAPLRLKAAMYARVLMVRSPTWRVLDVTWRDSAQAQHKHNTTRSLPSQHKYHALTNQQFNQLKNAP